MYVDRLGVYVAQPTSEAGLRSPRRQLVADYAITLCEKKGSQRNIVNQKNTRTTAEFRVGGDTNWNKSHGWTRDWKIKQRKNGKVAVDELNTVNDLPLNWDGFLRTQKMTIIDRRTITTAPDVAASITTKVATFRWRRTDMSILSSPKAFHAEQLYSPKSSSLAWCITSKLRSPSVNGSAKKNERMRQTFRESQSWLEA